MVKSWWVALGAVGALAAGCGTDDHSKSAAAPAPEVVTRSINATTAQCAFGGSVIQAGLDLDGNGTLDDAEVQSSTVLCESAPVPAILFVLATEPPGAHCALGGTVVESGLDANGNGALDPQEIDHTEYVCGAALVSRLVAVAPGAACIAGGVAIQLGPDRDGDGILGDAEVLQTQYACGGALPGDAIVHSTGDLAALASITEIAGKLELAAGLSDVALPALVHAGSVAITDDAVTHVSLPALLGVDGAITVRSSPRLTQLALPALVHAGSIDVALDDALTDVSLPVLFTVDGALTITDNPALAAATVAAVNVGGPVRFDRDGQLATLELPRLSTAGELTALANPQLTTISATSLTLVAEDIEIRLNDRLAAISLGVAGADRLNILENDALTTLDLSIVTRGNAVIRAAQPLALSQAPRTREGGLTLAGPISLPAAPQLFVGGDCQLDGTKITAIAVNSRVGGDLQLINNPDLVTLPGIEILGGVEVRNNAKLINLGGVTGREVNGALTISDNPLLTLTTILKGNTTRVHGNVIVRNNPSLTELFGPQLSRIDGTLTLDHNTALSDPGLGGLAFASAIEIDDCDAMTAVTLPELTSITSSITIRGNDDLLTLALPALQTADLGVFDNPHVPACAVAALFARLGGQHQQSGNDDTATCSNGGTP